MEESAVAAAEEAVLVDVFCAEVGEGSGQYVMVNLQEKNEIRRHATEIQMQASCQGCPIPHRHCFLAAFEESGGTRMV